MPSIEAEIDAHFYELIHKSVTLDSAEDRRAHQREPFSPVQRVAPYDGSNLPQPTNYVDVHCHDLSRGGFSYLSPIRPTSTRLIAVLGVPPDMTCVETRIVDTVDVLQYPSTGLLEKIGEPHSPIQSQDPSDETGVPLILVNCQFVRRLTSTEDTSLT